MGLGFKIIYFLFYYPKETYMEWKGVTIVTKVSRKQQRSQGRQISLKAYLWPKSVLNLKLIKQLKVQTYK